MRQNEKAAQTISPTNLARVCIFGAPKTASESSKSSAILLSSVPGCGYPGMSDCFVFSMDILARIPASSIPKDFAMRNFNARTPRNRPLTGSVIRTGMAGAILIAVIVALTSVSTPASADETWREWAEKWIDRVLSVGGSSLPAVDPLLHANEITCGVLLPQVNARLAELMTEMENPDPAGAIARQKYERLSAYKTKLEKACQDAGVEKTPVPPGGEGAGTETTPSNGPGQFHPSVGWTVDEQACAVRCNNAWLAFSRASLAAVNADDEALNASKLAADAQADADAKAKTLAEAEARRQKALDLLHAGTIPPTKKQQDALKVANGIVNIDLTGLRKADADAKAEAVRQSANSSAKAAAAQKADALAVSTRAAYRACVAKCLEQGHQAQPNPRPATEPAPPPAPSKKICKSTGGIVGSLNKETCQVGP
jgi:hypothetical protein